MAETPPAEEPGPGDEGPSASDSQPAFETAAMYSGRRKVPGGMYWTISWTSAA